MARPAVLIAPLFARAFLHAHDDQAPVHIRQLRIGHRTGNLCVPHNVGRVLVSKLEPVSEIGSEGG